MDKTRMQKVNSQMVQIISDIIRNDIKNPAIDGIISVTAVDTTRDLRHAKVYLSIYGGSEEKNKATFDAIRDAKSFVRRQIASQVNWHCVPELAFIMDESLKKSQRINDLLKQINETDK